MAKSPIGDGVQDSQLNQLHDLIKQVTITSAPNRWRWYLQDMDEFSVKGLRSHIDCLFLSSHYLATSWNKIMPRKVNIHAWRVVKDRIPTRFNLWFRGVHHNSLICPTCGNGIETIFHVFSECYMAKRVWYSIRKWLSLDIPLHYDPVNLLSYVENMDKAKAIKEFVIIIIFNVWWELWKFRNDIVFNPSKKRDVILVDAIINSSFFWFRNRSIKTSIGWDEWIKNPLLAF
uniref:uncharacterized protein LOC122592993 n=1 Tax=Erigeron canadensis TaxID=72917 RepID=UPI001CB94101|nr:uncharacterized protein LOC122592993 [Erigeron canadensis]